MKLIAFYEGDILHSYRCPAGVLSIGKGHTGRDVYAGMVITQAQSDYLFQKDSKVFSDYVNKKVPVGLPSNETDAYISVCYNAGFILRGDFLNAIVMRNKDRISYYNNKIITAKVRGVRKVLPGLVKRRNSENILRIENRLDFVKR